MPTKGNVKFFTLLIDFPDYPASGGANGDYSTSTQIDSAVFGDGSLIPTNPYPYESLKNYYERSSYNQLHFSGMTLGYYRAGYTRASMGDNPTTAQREQLIKEAIASFDGTVDFSQFDNDGDGKIEYFMVIWTGPDNGWSNFWWSYKTNWSDSSYTVDGVKLGFYSWDWAGGDYASVNPVKPFEPYVVMHETGHGLGLPDYYDYDDTVGPDGGIGGLDMMDSNWGDHNCFSKWIFEWITPTVVASGSQTVTLNPSGTSPDAVLIMPGATSTNAFREFYIAQNRYRSGNDPATSVPISYGKYPADGMLVWHVDARLNAAGTDYAWDNSYTGHKLLKLMQADGLDRIENGPPSGGATADAAMYYQPGNALGPLTAPSSRDYEGVDSGVNITGITHSWPQMTATFSIDNPRVLPTLTVVKAGNGSGTVTSADGGISYGSDNQESYSPGTTVTLTAVAAPGSRFVGWSGGGLYGAGTATINLTSDTTVTATFSTTLLLDEDFDPVSSSLPSGWTKVTTSGSASWWFTYTDYNDTGGSGGCALGATYGSGPYDSELQTYSMDASTYSSLGLEFKTSIENSGSTADVDVSVNGSSGPWTTVWEKAGRFAGPQTVDIDLTATAAGHNNVMLRFHHYGTGIWWVLDDVKVMGVPRLSTGASIPVRFGKGALLATQTRPTGFADNKSEIDQLYGTSDGGNLRLGITGNIENNSGNGIIILLDTKPGGSNPFNYGGSGASGRITGLDGDTLDTGFSPDYAIDTNLASGVLYADLYDLQAGTLTNLGSVTAPGTVGFAGGGEVSFDNSNTAGVTDTDASNAATATTGLEISLPLSRIGNPTGPVKVMVLIQANSNYHSNQTLPGLPDTYGNLGGGAQNYAKIPGRQYVTVTPAWTASDLPMIQLPWTFEDRAFTGDSSLDNHPPVVDSPTVYNGRVYAVEDVEHYGGSHSGYLVAVKTTDGTLDTAFGTNGRIALSGPATGRVAVRSVGDTDRLFVATSDGTLYSMDASTGANIHSIALGGSTSCSPAVSVIGTSAITYIPVNTSGTWQLKQVTDTASMGVTGYLNLAGATNVASSPSVIADGTRVQLGCVTASGGVVYTISSDLGTVFNGAVTANPVTAPPTLASDSLKFYVGDDPSSGSGTFYCFNASNGSQIASTAISGGLEYAPFGDYSLGGITNALYFATSTGQLNAVDPSTLSQLSGYPATPLGLEPAAGAVTLLNGQIYLPTAIGMFAVPSAAPASFSRFPVEGQASTVSSTGRVAGSVMATTSAAGLVNGLMVQ
jgi:M6 family metalloprotease-like protein